MAEISQLRETLIPSRYNNADRYPYLQPYFESAQNFDVLYLSVNYADLALISSDWAPIVIAIEATIKANAYKWEKLYKTTLLEYNPIWNVDGTEVEEHEIGERKTTSNYDDTRSEGTTSQVPDDMTSEKEVGKNVTTIDAHEDVVTEASAYDKITKTRSGNIGVTKTQDMIKDERGVAVFNYVDIVITDIINTITLPFYVED